MPTDDGTLLVKFEIAETLQDVLIAELSEAGFWAFEQTEATLSAFASPTIWSETLATVVREWLIEHHLSPDFRTSILPARNWNEIWEASLQPVTVGPFTIKPSWIAPAPEHAPLVLEIDPKMSFGTGYHASTRLALRLLPDTLKRGDDVLDAGGGTGVLSIAAARLGAGSVFCFDNDPWAIRNALENVERNDVAETVTVRLGEVGCVPDTLFNVILANIHLRVIDLMMPAFVSKLNRAGRIVVSGLLTSDQPQICAMADEFQLAVIQEVSEGEWYAAMLSDQDD